MSLHGVADEQDLHVWHYCIGSIAQGKLNQAQRKHLKDLGFQILFEHLESLHWSDPSYYSSEEEENRYTGTSLNLS